MTTSSICTRSIATAFAFSIASVFAPIVSAATEATTVPVGFITQTIPAAPTVTKPSNVVLSIPLYQTATYSSSVASLVSATQFTLTGSFSAGAFVTVPNIVRVKTSATAAHVGNFFLISANTTNQLTVQLPTGVANINTVLSVGDTCEIVPANTLSSVFNSILPLIKKSDDASTADNVLIWNGASWETYYYDPNWNGPSNGAWASASSLDAQDNTVIFPDEGVFYIHRLTASVPLVLMGTVPSTNERSDVAGGTPAHPGYTFISNRFPVNATLSSLKLNLLLGWVSGDDAAVVDNVLLWNGTSWDTYYYDPNFNGPSSGAWASASSLDPQDTTPVPPGKAVFVIRKGGTRQALANTIPYVP